MMNNDVNLTFGWANRKFGNHIIVCTQCHMLILNVSLNNWLIRLAMKEYRWSGLSSSSVFIICKVAGGQNHVKVGGGADSARHRSRKPMAQFWWGERYSMHHDEIYPGRRKIEFALNSWNEGLKTFILLLFINESATSFLGRFWKFKIHCHKNAERVTTYWERNYPYENQRLSQEIEKWVNFSVVFSLGLYTPNLIKKAQTMPSRLMSLKSERIYISFIHTYTEIAGHKWCDVI